MDTVNLEVYSPAHQQEVISLILNIQRNEFGVEITEQDQPDLKNVKSFYQHGNGQFWVAKIGATIVGTIALIDIGDQQAVIRKMFVKAEFRGPKFNIAQKLLDLLLVWSNNKKIKAIYLGTIDKYAAAQRFYQKNSFQKCLKSQLPKTFPLIAVDNVFYYYNVES